ncbi:KP86L [African swine fever virus]
MGINQSQHSMGVNQSHHFMGVNQSHHFMGINQSQHSMGVNQHIIGDSYLISCMVVAPCCLKAAR